MRLRYKVLIALAVVIAAATVAGVLIFKQMERDLAQLAQIEIGQLDLAAVDDGTYTGGYAAGPVRASVEVEVRDHAIVDLAILEHDNGQGEAAEAILGDVIRAQSLQVDAIAGATYSSKVLLLSIEDALTGQKDD